MGDVIDPDVAAIKLSEVQRIVAAVAALLADTSMPTKASEMAALPRLDVRTFYRTEVQLTRSPNSEVCRVPMRPRMSTDSLYALRSAAALAPGPAVFRCLRPTRQSAHGLLRNHIGRHGQGRIRDRQQ